MNQIIVNDNFLDFYDFVKKVYYKKTKILKPENFHVIFDYLLECSIEEEIYYMSFESMVMSSEQLIFYYTRCALDRCNLVYELNGIIYNSYNQKIFGELESNVVSPDVVRRVHSWTTK